MTQGVMTLIFRYFLRYFSSTHRTDLSRFRGTFHSFDPVGFAIFAIPQAQVALRPWPSGFGSGEPVPERKSVI
jgi:hypothetical protein